MNKSEHVLAEKVEVYKQLHPAGERNLITPCNCIIHNFI